MPPRVAPAPPANQLQVAKQFNSFKPPSFNGRDGPAGLEEWLGRIEDILELLMCTDAQKVSCATFVLQEDTRIWWNSYKGMRPANEIATLTWEGFKQVINEKYCPPSYRVRMETEFFNLKQGNMKVEEYEREFSRLSRFAPHLADTEAKKVQRFRQCLRPEIRNVVAGQGITTLAETYARAEEIANIIHMDAPKENETNESGKRKWENPNSKGQNKTLKIQENSVVGDKPVCTTCRRNHRGECLMGQGKCFRCKQTGHKAYDYPRSS